MQFKKMPVVIDAIQYTGDNKHDVLLFLGQDPLQAGGKSDFIPIETKEGTMTASTGDWIIKGVEGEFYPCKPSVFAKTYQAAIFPRRVVRVPDQSHMYDIPYFDVTDKGLVEVCESRIHFAKGAKDDPSKPRQAGFLVETLIACVVEHLKSVNVGELASRETSTAITNFETGLMWLGKRNDDREKAGVQGTYKPTPPASAGPGNQPVAKETLSQEERQLGARQG